MNVVERKSWCAPIIRPLHCIALSTVLFTGVVPVYAEPVEHTEPGAAQSTPLSPSTITGTQILSATDLSSISNLTVSEGATLIIDIGSATAATVGGSITNSGTVYAISTVPLSSIATFNANAFTNQQGAIFTSVIPQGGIAGLTNLAPNLSIAFNVGSFLNHGLVESAANLNIQSATEFVNTGTLSAMGNIVAANAGGALVNQGVIQSLQNIVMTSGVGQILNSGTITATTGNVNINSLINSLTVNNLSGTINALNGGINLGVLDGLKTDINVLGGDFISRELNLYTNGGNIAADVQQVTGVVNTFADYVQFGASTDLLTLGNIYVADPTYFNDAGSILISGDVVVNESLAIIASQDIVFAGIPNTPHVVRAQDLNGNGFQIHLVAGANVTGPNSIGIVSGNPPAGAAVGDVTVNGASITGGNINLAAGSFLTLDASSVCGGCPGGNVTLAAYQDSNNLGLGGRIILAPPTTTSNGTVIDVSGGPGGNAGNVFLIAGGTGAAVEVGAIWANGATPGGNVFITAAQPTSVDGQPIVFGTNGAINSGNFFIPSNNTPGASVEVRGHIQAANSINIAADGNIFSRIDSVATLGPVAGSGRVTMFNNFLYYPNLGNQIVVVDTLTNSVVTTIPVGVLPTALATSGSFVYVTDSASNSVSVINTSTNTVVAVIPVGNTPIDIAANPVSNLIYVANSGSNSVTIIDGTTNTVVNTVAVGALPTAIAVSPASGKVYVNTSIAAELTVIEPTTLSTTTLVSPGIVTSFGPCPCSTKIFLGMASGDVNFILTENNQFGPGGISANGSSGIGVTPNGATAWALSSAAPVVTTIDTLTNNPYTSYSGAGSIVPGHNGFVTFVGDVPTAYVAFNGVVEAIQMGTLSAPNITLQSDSGNITVATGASNINASAQNGSVQINSAGNLTLVGGGSANAYQLATVGNVAINAPLTSGLIDMHAISGTFTNNSDIIATNGSLFVAAPNVINNGIMTSTGGTGEARLAFQAPNGALNLTQGPTGSLNAIGTNGLGRLSFNPGGGSSVVVNGGIMMPTDEVVFHGNAGHTVDVNVAQLGPGGFSGTPTIDVPNRASSISITAQGGDINTCNCLTTANANGSGGDVTLNAVTGIVFLSGGIITDGFGVGNRAGNINLFGGQGVFSFGPISAQGLGGASGGNITITAPDGPLSGIQVIDFSVGITSAADGVGNGGNITITAPVLTIDAVNGNGDSINASSVLGNAGNIQITTTSSLSGPLTIGLGCGCNLVSGNIVADSTSGNAGRITLGSISGFEVGQGTSITANSATGNAGVILFSLPTANSGGFALNNNGSILAGSFVPGTGAVGFATGGGPLTVTGQGILSAGDFVSIGMLDPVTGFPFNPFVSFDPTNPFNLGNISISQGGITTPRILVNFGPRPTTTSTTGLIAPTMPDFNFVPVGSLQLLPNTTILSTDQEHQHIPIGKNNLFRNIDRAGADPESLIHALRIDSGITQPSQAAFASILPGAESGIVNLERGNLLVTAGQNVRIRTAHGDVFIPQGAAALIMQSDSATSFYNLHDEGAESVMVSIGGVQVPVELGTQILITANGDSFDSLNTGAKIATRRLRSSKLPDGQTVYAADFSIPAAIRWVEPLANLSRTDRGWAERIMRDAAILMTLTARAGAYSSHQGQ